jgi:hypothetical protein
VEDADETAVDAVGTDGRSDAAEDRDRDRPCG